MVLQKAPRVNLPRLVPVGEASQILNVHPNTLRKWSDRGLIPSFRIGLLRDRRFAVEDLLAFLEVDDTSDEDYGQAANGFGDSWTEAGDGETRPYADG